MRIATRTRIATVSIGNRDKVAMRKQMKRWILYSKLEAERRAYMSMGNVYRDTIKAIMGG